MIDDPQPGVINVAMVGWVSAKGSTPRQDKVAREEPLEIRIHGRCVAVAMRTPGNDAQLAAGFLLSEGIIRGPEDVLEIAHCRQGDVANRQNILNVFLAPAVEIDFEKLTRHVYTSSSCGLCGKASIEAVHQHFSPLKSPMRISAQVLLALPDRLRAAQKAFDQTGGIHAAAIFTQDGEMMVVHEDVGRHNAVDKCIGAALLEDRLPLEAHVLLVSGRASFEIVQKALAARIAIVAAISAPSSLAVEFAQDSGQTLVGFLRGNSMNIYAGKERIFDRGRRPTGRVAKAKTPTQLHSTET